MSQITLYIGDEQKLKLLALKDDAGAFINTALVKATMTDRGGVAVAEINNATLASVDSSGNYAYVIPATFSPALATAAQPYDCVITITVGGVLKRTIHQQVIVQSDIG
jgi:hypothetical protein